MNCKVEEKVSILLSFTNSIILKKVMKPLNAEEQEEQDRALSRNPTYLKFLYKVSNYIRKDPTWPPKELIPGDVDNVYSYAACLEQAKDRLIESLVEREPNFLSQEEQQYLKQDEFLTFEDDLVVTLFPSILQRLGKPMESRFSKK